MTVAELIEELKKYPEHFEVSLWTGAIEGSVSCEVTVEATHVLKYFVSMDRIYIMGGEFEH